MKKTPRFVLNLLVPPGVAAFLFIVPASLVSAKPSDWRLAVLVLMFAYILGALPSVAHAFLMERIYRRGVRPDQLLAVVFSALSGSVAGLLIAIGFFLLPENPRFGAFWFYLPLGTLTGAITALLILSVSRSMRKRPNKAPEPTPVSVTPRATEGDSK